MYKSRSIPLNMGYKECQALVVAAAAYYYDRMAVGEAVCHIWKMSDKLEDQIRDIVDTEMVVNQILSFQQSQRLE